MSAEGPDHTLGTSGEKTWRSSTTVGYRAKMGTLGRPSKVPHLMRMSEALASPPAKERMRRPGQNSPWGTAL